MKSPHMRAVLWILGRDSGSVKGLLVYCRLSDVTGAGAVRAGGFVDRTANGVFSAPEGTAVAGGARMSRFTYWYPMNDWQPGDGAPDAQAVGEAALRFNTLGVTELVIGVDGRKLNATWNYLDGFDSRAFRQDLETTLDLLFDAGYAGDIAFMPINGNYNWQTDNQARSFWMVNATLDFIGDSAHRDKVTGLVTDTEFVPTADWRDADNAGRADVLRQYAALLEGIDDRVKAFDPTLTTTTYQGAHIDKGDTRFVLDGSNYGNVATIGAHVDRIILPIRLTDAIDPNADHDFDALVRRVVAQTADELAHLDGTGSQIIVDFEWEESHRDLGAPNYFAQVEAAMSQAVLDHPAFAGVAVYIHSTLSTVALTDLRISGLASAEMLKGTDGADTVFGNAGADTIEAGAGRDLVSGGDGDDSILGGLGNDVLRGGSGADALRGGSGFDLADYSFAWRAVALDLSGQTGNAGAASGDMLFSVEAVRGSRLDDDISGNRFRNVLHGNDGDDRLDGAGGTDKLIGGRGDDTLTGGVGDDRMTGNEGADRFVFRAGDGQDRISDFDPALDGLRFEAGTALSVSDDGVHTRIDYGADSVVLEHTVLQASDLTVDFF